MANIWHSLQLLRGGFSYLKRNKEYIRTRARARVFRLFLVQLLRARTKYDNAYWFSLHPWRADPVTLRSTILQSTMLRPIKICCQLFAKNVQKSWWGIRICCHLFAKHPRILVRYKDSQSKYYETSAKILMGLSSATCKNKNGFTKQAESLGSWLKPDVVIPN